MNLFLIISLLIFGATPGTVRAELPTVALPASNVNGSTTLHTTPPAYDVFSETNINMQATTPIVGQPIPVPAIPGAQVYDGITPLPGTILPIPNDFEPAQDPNVTPETPDTTNDSSTPNKPKKKKVKQSKQQFFTTLQVKQNNGINIPVVRIVRPNGRSSYWGKPGLMAKANFTYGNLDPRYSDTYTYTLQLMKGDDILGSIPAQVPAKLEPVAFQQAVMYQMGAYVNSLDGKTYMVPAGSDYKMRVVIFMNGQAVAADESDLNFTIVTKPNLLQQLGFSFRDWTAPNAQ